MRAGLAGLAGIVLAPAWLACSPGEAPAPPPPSVTVLEVAPRPAVSSEEYVARIAASNAVEVRPQIDGLLEKQAAVEGQRVEAGALLFQIDPAPFHAALSRAEAERAQAEALLAKARRELARVKSLARQNVASEQALDAAESEEKAASASVRAAVANVETARLNLAYTRVTSPIAGAVGRAETRIGAAVKAYDTLLTRVYANDEMYVDFAIGEQRMLQMQRDFGPHFERGAGEFRIRLADGSDYPHAGRLDFVDSALDEKTATLPMRLVVPNPEGLLRANQFARVIVPVESIPDALVVPVRAVQDFQGTHSVWVVDETGQAQTRDVELGARLGDAWIVRRGLEPGARVVVDGAQKLRPGLAVSAQPMVATTAGTQDVAAKAPVAEATAPRNGS
ncbi:MAG: efflux RND transporter periplasmic adaptor subunit [Myxococcota bacterium]